MGVILSSEIISTFTSITVVHLPSLLVFGLLWNLFCNVLEEVNRIDQRLAVKGGTGKWGISIGECENRPFRQLKSETGESGLFW